MQYSQVPERKKECSFLKERREKSEKIISGFFYQRAVWRQTKIVLPKGTLLSGKDEGVSGGILVFQKVQQRCFSAGTDFFFSAPLHRGETKNVFAFEEDICAG